MCNKVGNLSNMGRQALLSHMGSKKHLEKEKARNETFDMSVYVKPPESAERASADAGKSLSTYLFCGCLQILFCSFSDFF